MIVKFVTAKYKKKVDLPLDKIKELVAENKVVLFTTIQYHDQLSRWKKELEGIGKEVITFRPRHASKEGQLLGCGIEEWELPEGSAFLYIGDGDFHPTALMINNKEKVYRFNPKSGEFSEVSREKAEEWVRRERGALMKFYNSEKVGVLVTRKYGQQRIKMALDLKKRFPEKKFYYFLGNDLDFRGLEDFNFIECWVNTMCPRIGLDDSAKSEKPIVDIGALGYEW